MTQLIDTGIPLLQPTPHALDLLHVQNLGLYPVDLRDLRDLVDRPLHQTQ